MLPQPSSTVFNFYPRSPCGERLLQHSANCNCHSISIHALLAESDPRSRDNSMGRHISIHALLAESDASDISIRREARISIHALLAESDFPIVPVELTTLVFLSTLSLRRATQAQSFKIPAHRDFYPRSPCGERRGHDFGGRITQRFLSTLSLRRATSANCSCHNARPDFYPRSPCGERRGYG